MGRAKWTLDDSRYPSYVRFGATESLVKGRERPRRRRCVAGLETRQLATRKHLLYFERSPRVIGYPTRPSEYIRLARTCISFPFCDMRSYTYSGQPPKNQGKASRYIKVASTKGAHKILTGIGGRVIITEQGRQGPQSTNRDTRYEK